MFPPESTTKALEFLEHEGLYEARIKLLLELGRIVEAAAVHAKNGNMLEAVETLNTSAARDVDLLRRMIEYLSKGLRPGFTLGVLPSSPSPTISRLLVLADQLDEAAMTEPGFDEVSLHPPPPFS